jgi:putative endonuclease
MSFTFIIYSSRLDKYYVGACINLGRRLYEHNIGYSKFISAGWQDSCKCSAEQN